MSNLSRAFRLKYINNCFARSNAMLGNLHSIVKDALAPMARCIGQWPLGNRTLRDWAPIVFATLKELGPYAMLELLLPGGSVLALTLWLYRRRRKAPAIARSLSVLL
jgi:hypothetical protein